MEAPRSRVNHAVTTLWESAAFPRVRTTASKSVQRAAAACMTWSSRSIAASRGRTTWWEPGEGTHKNFVYLETYNQRRAHRARGMEGRTPYEVFEAGIPRKCTHKPSARMGVLIPAHADQ